MSTRAGQVWLNDDQPTSWSVALVLASGRGGHSILILDAGAESGYSPGDVGFWEEHSDFDWDRVGENGCMTRLA